MYRPGLTPPLLADGDIIIIGEWDGFWDSEKLFPSSEGALTYAKKTDGLKSLSKLAHLSDPLQTTLRWSGKATWPQGQSFCNGHLSAWNPESRELFNVKVWPPICT